VRTHSFARLSVKLWIEIGREKDETISDIAAAAAGDLGSGC